MLPLPFGIIVVVVVVVSFSLLLVPVSSSVISGQTVATIHKSCDEVRVFQSSTRDKEEEVDVEDEMALVDVSWT